jgi:hypothetical protein
MLPREQVKVLGHPPFHTTHLTTSGALAYIGGNWEREVAFAGSLLLMSWLEQHRDCSSQQSLCGVLRTNCNVAGNSQ